MDSENIALDRDNGDVKENTVMHAYMNDKHRNENQDQRQGYALDGG